MRNAGWVATILIAAMIFVHDFGEFGSARAQGKPVPRGSAVGTALAPHWNHNGSLVSLLSNGAKQKFFYDTPRVGLLDAGVKPGTLLFEGQRSGTTIIGTAYQFYRTCKARGYQVSGNTSDDRRQITLKGKAPLLDANCKVTGTRDDVLVFTASQISPGEPPKDKPAAAAPAATATAQTPSSTSDANKSAVVGAAAPKAPPETPRVTETSAVEAGNAKSSETSAADNAVSVTSAVPPSEPPKDKPVTPNPGPEKAPPSEPAKDVQVAAIPPNASNTANSSAAGSNAAPSSEPAKDNQPVTAPGANGEPSKSDDSRTASVPAEQSSAAPQGEPPKGAQLAALPGAADGAAKDDPSKSKNSATVGGVVAPNNVPDTGKSGADSGKTPVLAEKRAVPTSAPEKIMEIVLKNGRILRIGRDIEPEALLKIISLLERE